MRLAAHFGKWREERCRGRNVRQWQVAAGLIYGQVKKSYRGRKLVRVSQVMRLGTQADLKAALQGLAFSGRLNTAFIERVNLTIRHGIAALARRTWATSQQASQLLVHLEWWRAYYHGCRVLTTHSEWRSCSHESEVANWWHNATGSGLQPWQPGEPTDDGQREKSFAIPSRQCHASQGEHEGSEKTSSERAGGGLVKVKTGTGALTYRMEHPLWSIE